MTPLLSTDAVPRDQRLAYWTDMICNVYVQLECDAVRTGDGGDFEGSIRQHALPGLGMSVVTSRAQKVMRTPGHIAASSDDCFLVSIQARGQGVVRQDGRDAVLGAGDFALYDSTRPYQLLFDQPFEQIVLKLPGERLRSELRDTEALTATTVSARGRGAPAAGHDPHAARGLRCAAAGLGAGGGPWRAEHPRGRPADAACGARTGAQQAHGVPPRAREAAHRRAAGRSDAVGGHAGGAAGHVGEPHPPRVQERAADALAVHLGAPARRMQPRPAGAAPGRAAGGRDRVRRGFNDAAHFSRAFRERFGCSPREWRQQRSPQ